MARRALVQRASIRGKNAYWHPFFPSDRTREFQAVHKVFGLSNLQKMVKSLNEDDKRRATDSLIWEAFCRQESQPKPYGEYRRLFDELKLYKSQLHFPIHVPTFGTSNGGVDQFGTGNNTNNYNVALLNYVQQNTGFGSNQYTCNFPHQKSPRGQGEQHLISGRCDQHNFKTGQFSPMNGESAMESITWDCGT